MSVLMGWIGGWLLAALAAPYLALDTFLRRVPPPESGLLGTCVIRGLWRRATPYRLTGLAVGLLVWAGMVGQWWPRLARPAGGPAFAAGTLAFTVLMDRWIWRFGLRKQFPHLRPWL